ncbi:kinase-like domain-containing protein [Flagelloscypha sp. PMI_526]|nr:kinase-like domain-containing protein [Flagelloscypha sp. PMI_526]
MSNFKLLTSPLDYTSIIAEGVGSTVSRVQAQFLAGDSPTTLTLIAKRASTIPQFVPEPHDILKEMKILRRCSHVNVVSFLGEITYRSYGEDDHAMCFLLELVDINLLTLLNLASFSPHLPPGSTTSPSRAEEFSILTKSIAYQLISALSYLHSDEVQVAHRDVKPANVLLTREGLVKLIDFGVSWDGLPSIEDDTTVWGETTERMYFEVSTGPYRAPELLFGTRTYDAYAIDLWSLGCLIAEFYTPLSLESDWDDFPSDEEEEVEGPTGSHHIPKHLLKLAEEEEEVQFAKWTRNSLFAGDRGEIGLAWSIFKIRGTPDEENWPSFKNLPDARSVQFKMTPTVDIKTFLPNLPPLPLDTSQMLSALAEKHFPPEEQINHPVDVILRLLVYPPERRIEAVDASRHVWFEDVLLPDGYPNAGGREGMRSLKDVLQTFLEGE